MRPFGKAAMRVMDATVFLTVRVAFSAVLLFALAGVRGASFRLPPRVLKFVVAYSVLDLAIAKVWCRLPMNHCESWKMLLLCTHAIIPSSLTTETKACASGPWACVRGAETRSFVVCIETLGALSEQSAVNTPHANHTDAVALLCGDQRDVDRGVHVRELCAARGGCVLCRPLLAGMSAAAATCLIYARTPFVWALECCAYASNPGR